MKFSVKLTHWCPIANQIAFRFELWKSYHLLQIWCFFVRFVGLLFSSFYIFLYNCQHFLFNLLHSWVWKVTKWLVEEHVMRRETHYCAWSAWNISGDVSHTNLAFWISLHRQSRDFSSLTSVRCWWSHVPFKWEMHPPHLHAIFSSTLNQNTFINIHLACLACMLTLFILASLYSQCTCSAAGEGTKEALWRNAWANC